MGWFSQHSSSSYVVNSHSSTIWLCYGVLRSPLIDLSRYSDWRISMLLSLVRAISFSSSRIDCRFCVVPNSASICDSPAKALPSHHLLLAASLRFPLISFVFSRKQVLMPSFSFRNWISWPAIGSQQLTMQALPALRSVGPANLRFLYLFYCLNYFRILTL